MMVVESIKEIFFLTTLLSLYLLHALAPLSQILATTQQEEEKHLGFQR